MTDPQRLLDDPSMAASLRADLAQAKAAGLAGFDVAAGAASLNAAIAAETGAVATVATATGLSKGLIAAIVGVVSAGAIAWFVAHGEPEPAAVPSVVARPPDSMAEPELSPESTSQPQPKRAPPTAAPKFVANAVDPEPAPAAAEPAPEPAAKRPAKHKRGKAAPTEAAPTEAAPTEANYLREAKLIAEARRAMKTEPKRALALLNEAKSEFPRGLLREERDALTILTLNALGRTDQARASAERFLDKHGEGPYADAVRQILR